MSYVLGACWKDVINVPGMSEASIRQDSFEVKSESSLYPNTKKTEPASVKVPQFKDSFAAKDFDTIDLPYPNLV